MNKVKVTTRQTTVLVATFVMIAMIPEVMSSSCVDITAGVSVANFDVYFFSGSEYTHYNSYQAMAGRGGQVDNVYSMSDVTGIDTDVEITAGYMEPNSNHVVRLFTTGNDVYRIEWTDHEAGRKVLEKLTTSDMFSSDLSKLQSGIQAAAATGQHIYYFSGCNVLKMDASSGNVLDNFELNKVSLPCDVDAAFAYPSLNADHLVITKGAETYGWFPGVANGYYMFCVANVFPGLPFDLCRCDDMAM